MDFKLNILYDMPFELVCMTCAEANLFYITPVLVSKLEILELYFILVGSILKDKLLMSNIHF